MSKDGADRVITNIRTGQTGGYAEWVGAFAQLWAGGRDNLDRFADVLDPDVVLVSPGIRRIEGRKEVLSSFGRLFGALPDLTGEVTRWSADGDALFVEMIFSATVGGKRIHWHNVDRFLFRDGRAVERVAYFDPTTLRRALLRNPSGLRQLLRLRRGA